MTTNYEFTTESTYQIAFQMEDGNFDVVATITAANDEAAELEAERRYHGREWYVLQNGCNINA